MAWVGPAIGAGASLLGGILGHSAQSKANKTNVALQREQQNWERQMSNTAYQRGTQDMLKAGLNPMLAYSQGGASTPSVSAATVQPKMAMAEAINTAGSKAMQVLQQENLALNNQILVEKKDQEHVNTRVLQEQYPITENGRPSERSEAERQKALNEARRVLETANLAEIERKIAQASSDNRISSAKSLAEAQQQEVDINELRKRILKADIPEKEAMAKWFGTIGAASPAMKMVMTVGQWLKYILGK